MNDWEVKLEEQPVKRRCGACNAPVTVETNGTNTRLKFHTVGNHQNVPGPACVASHSSDPGLMLPLRLHPTSGHFTP